MPRFLNTYTGRFHWVGDPSKIIYAILSHTWQSEEEGGEQSYADIEHLRQSQHTPRRHEKPPANSERAHPWTTPSWHATLYTDRHPDSSAELDPILGDDSGLSDKIRNACRIAREAGYQLIWIDSGCIDKSSSAELAEAINSMFELYTLADVCFVHLADVPSGDDPCVSESAFWNSRWHRRGWTLQELIAPRNVVFLAADWTFLGTKNGLASILERITRIDSAILMGRASLDSVSVARRMSWAAIRKTTRIEDEAYALLGIFGVHLSPIYGEGRNAFLRLQEEIIRSIPDQSIFVWGDHHITMKSMDDLVTVPSSGNAYSGHGLLASSPKPFLGTEDTVSLTAASFASRLCLSDWNSTALPLHCVFTPNGVRLTLLTIDCGSGGSRDPRNLVPRLTEASKYGDGPDRGECSHQVTGDIAALALLQCEATSTGSIIALALLRPSLQWDQNRGLHVGTVRDCGCEHRYRTYGSCRLVHLTPDTLSNMRLYYHLVPRPAQVYILRASPWTPEPRRYQNLLYISADRSVRVAGSTEIDDQGVSINLPHWPCTDDAHIVRVAPWCKESLQVLGFTASPLEAQYTDPNEQAMMVFAVSLTSLNNPPSESLVPQRSAQVVRILVTLRRGSLSTPADEGELCALSVRFSVENSIHGSPTTRQDSPWRRFSLDKVEATPRLRTLSEGVFVIQVTPMERDHWKSPWDGCPPGPGRGRRRILRLSLECPREYFYSLWKSSPAIPYVWLSIELSDVVTVALGPEDSRAESIHENSTLLPPFGGSGVYQAGFRAGSAYTLQDGRPLADECVCSASVAILDVEPGASPMVCSGELPQMSSQATHAVVSQGSLLGSVERLLGNARREALHQLKKLVGSVALRRRGSSIAR